MDHFVITKSSREVNCNYSTSLARKDLIIGRHKEVEKILQLMTHGSTREIFSVIFIIGMCGIGKSIVAQVVYEESIDFDMKIWVSASEYVVKITRFIYLCAIEGEESVDDLYVLQADLNILQVKLNNKFRGKKYLLVLDGYLSVSFNDWKVLSLPFDSGKSQCTVIITTQSDRVSSTVG
ncbi:hypothetical protein LIER_31987 [Lithospermum erythrorhizon]|uniref:NB-ARC domain-containing protein n=1 Tax=Lithospermum erythrorhizon TaxID=34254 RepID=A0AAV3RW79_LITER